MLFIAGARHTRQTPVLQILKTAYPEKFKGMGRFHFNE
jgi:hypothetical protein